MRSLYDRQQKIIAYIMVALLIVNLFSGYMGGTRVSAQPASDLSTNQSSGGTTDTTAAPQGVENSARSGSGVPAYSLKVYAMSEENPTGGDRAADKSKVKVTYEAGQWDSAEGYTAYRIVKKDGTKIIEGELVFDESDTSDTRQVDEIYRITSEQDEGIYEVVYYLKKGSEELEKQQAVFILDKTEPEVQTEASPSFEEKVTYGVTVTEQNFDSCSVIVYVEQITIDEKKEYTLSNADAGLTLENGKKKEMEFEEEGLYTVYTVAKDLAGNTATSEKTTFVIDNTAPVLSIKNASDYSKVDGLFLSTRNNPLELRLEVTDLSLQDCSVTVMRDGREQDKDKVSSLVWKEDGHTGYTALSFDGAAEDGSYQIILRAKDKNPGNGEKTETAEFVIDNTDPVIEINDVQISYDKQENTPVEVFEEAGKEVYYLRDNARVSFKVTEQNWSSAQVSVQTMKEGTGRVEPQKPLPMEEPEDLTISRSTMWVAYGEEGSYTTVIQGQDAAGNKSREHTRYFVIDKKAPEFQIQRLENGKWTDMENNAAYKDRSGQRLRFSVKEENQNTDGYQIKVTKRTENRSHPVVTVLQNNIKWEEGENTGIIYYENSSLFSEEGRYTVEITGKDKAGNEPEVKTVVSFVVDTEGPELAIAGVTNQQKTKNPVTVTFRTADRNHDYGGYNIHVTRSNVEEELESFDIKGTTLSAYDVGKTGWTEREYTSEEQKRFLAERTLRFSEEGVYEITFTGTDLAQNEAQEQRITFYIDHTAPQITNLRYSDVNGLIREKYYNIYSNKAIMVEFSVKDMVTLVNDQRVYVRAGTAQDRIADAPLLIAHKSAGNRYYVYVPTDLRVNEFNNPVTIWAEDVLGNENHVTSTNLVYNTAVPTIRMECDTDYSKWTNRNVTFHTTVADEKSGLKEVIYRVNGKTVKRVTFDKPVTSYDYAVTASESADRVTGYGVEVEVTNNCGTSNAMKRQVYIDKEKPQVTLSGVRNGTHYNTSQVFKTDVQDVSYNQTRTVYVISRSLDGRTHRASAAVFRSGKYEDACNRKIIKEGLYKIYAITTDGAGNQMVSNTITFVIDKTAPKVAVSGIGEDSMSGTPVTLEFTCEESFYATNRVSIEVEKSLDGAVTTEEIGGFPRNAGKRTMRHTFSEDGTYIVTISATDKAGNTARSQTIHFSVDRTKPEIRITGTDNYEQWSKPATVQFSVEESYYSGNRVMITGTRTDIDGTVTEVELPQFINSGKLSSLSQTFLEDGIYSFEIVSRDEAGNEDSREIHFTVDRTRPQIHKVGSCDGKYYQEFKLADSLEEIFKDLTVISYRILLNGVEYNGTDEITEEGKYNLYVKVEDELGHHNSESVEFIIDHTAPKVIFTGVKDGENVQESGEVTLTLTNAGDEITAVRMNGVEYDANTRALRYSEHGSYRIEVDCRDKAGNEVTRTLYFVYNNPLTIALLPGGMGFLIVFTCVCLWIRRRRKEKEEKRI